MSKTPLEIAMEKKKKTCMSCESRTEIDGVSYCKVDGKMLPRAAICPLFARKDGEQDDWD